MRGRVGGCQVSACVSGRAVTVWLQAHGGSGRRSLVQDGVLHGTVERLGDLRFGGGGRDTQQQRHRELLEGHEALHAGQAGEQ